MSRATVFLVLLVAAPAVLGAQLSAAEVAASYQLSASLSLPFPTAPLSSSDANNFLVANWNLDFGHVENNPQDISFVVDPFPLNSVPDSTNSTTSSGPVMEILYQTGSFQSQGDGGAQFFAEWNAPQPANAMMLTYEVAFDEGFQWVMGGKLPGLRGGTNTTGCSGGDKPTGDECFSARLMWRTGGAGEIYMYIPTPNGLCDDAGIICNTDFGTSINRGAFNFVAGSWNRVTLLVWLNSPPNVANGFVSLYFNDVEAIAQPNLQIRSADSVTGGGMFFSTFFGGDDPSWESPSDQHTYFRNIQMFSGTSASNLTGQLVQNSAVGMLRRSVAGWTAAVVTVVLATVAGTILF